MEKERRINLMWRWSVISIVVVGLFLSVWYAARQTRQQKPPEGDQIIIFSEDDEVIVWRNGEPLLNFVILSQYYRRHETGEYPMGKSQARETLARAIELVLNKGYELRPNFKLSVSARGTVPIQITLNGKGVPLRESDFKPLELKIARFAAQAATAR